MSLPLNLIPTMLGDQSPGPAAEQRMVQEEGGESQNSNQLIRLVNQF